jgi:hypothetical protein
MWRDGEPAKQLNGRTNVVYDCKGTVKSVCPETGKSGRGATAGSKRTGTRCPVSLPQTKKCIANSLRKEYLDYIGRIDIISPK